MKGYYTDFIENLQNDEFAGTDEVGRGCLAGPVVVASVILPKNFDIALKDSKKLSPKMREKLFFIIKSRAIAWSIIEVDAATIDKINILQATLLAMKLSLDALPITPKGAIIDGNQVPKNLSIPAISLVKGDDKVPSIQAASILAKVHRDTIISQLDGIYPEYKFSSHKGYATKIHKEAIGRYGMLNIHRKSFLKCYNV